MRSLFFAVSLILLSHAALAAKVTIVKGKKVMIDLEGESAAAGSEFFVLTPQGKKVAIVKVTQAKNGRAVAEIVKGTAKVGYALQARGGGSAGPTGAASSSGDTTPIDTKVSQKGNSGNSWGVVGSYLMNSMSVVTSTINANLSGAGFGALGFYDYALSPSITLRGMAGLENFEAKGTNSAPSPGNSCTVDCNVKLPYISMYGYGQWNIFGSKSKTWLGGGLGYLYPMSPSSTIFNKAQLGANQVFMFALGTNMSIGNKSFIPISLEYGLYPTTSTVKANIIYLRLGYAWNL